MSSWMVGRFTVVLFVIGLLLGLDQAAAEVLFPDESLEAVVRKNVFSKRDNEEPLTADDVKDLSQIIGKGKGIKDLSGLEKCASLALLDLADNEISDLGPLQGLKRLQSLTLSKNKIKDLDPIEGLIGLQYLHVAGNEIVDLSPVAELTAINVLYASNNQIKGLEPVRGLKKLWSLYVDGNHVSDLDPLKDLRWLSSLDLKGNQVSDLSLLSGLKQLRYLFLDRNKVADIDPVVEMCKKDVDGEKGFAQYLHLYLSGNPLSEASKEGLKSLQEIGVRVALE